MTRRWTGWNGVQTQRPWMETHHKICGGIILCANPLKLLPHCPAPTVQTRLQEKKKEGAFNFISGGHTFLTNISLPRAKRWICGYSESIVREEAVPFYTLHFGAPEETLGKRFKGGRGDALLTKKIFDFIFKAEFSRVNNWKQNKDGVYKLPTLGVYWVALVWASYKKNRNPFLASDMANLK